MKKTLITLIAFLQLLIVNIYAQQTPHYTQYMYNMNVLNPAYAGVRADLSVGLLGRSQWVGLEGAPKTQTFSINARAFDGIGLGLSVVHDKLGLFEDTSVNADVSYTVVTSPQSRLSLGIKGGFSNYSNNLSQGITPDNDVYGDITGNHINFGVGAFYYNQNFYAGFSMPQMFKTPKFKLDRNYTGGLSDSMSYFLTSGMVFNVNDDVKFKPSTLVKLTSGLPLSVDINANLLYKETIEFGASYRYNDSVSGLIALLVNKSFRIGYTYDYTLTNLGNYNSGSHEIMLLFDLDFGKRSRWLNDSSCYF